MQGLMNIAKTFCQSPGVTSQVKTFLMVCCFQTHGHLNGFGTRLNSSGYLFKKKKLSHVRMACANCSKKIVIYLNGLGYPFEKIVIHLNG